MILNKDNIPDNVVNAIHKGSKIAGIDPGFMFAMAKQESGFNPNAKAATSSATGLYQFIGSTWKGMVDKYGKQYGINHSDIKDPEANAIMGALFAKENKQTLEKAGIDVDPTDLYFAHFMGAGSAVKFIKGAMQDGNQSAINLVSDAAAKANRSIFYHKNGSPRTAKEVYELFDKKVGQPARAFTLALNDQESDSGYEPPSSTSGIRG